MKTRVFSWPHAAPVALLCAAVSALAQTAGTPGAALPETVVTATRTTTRTDQLVSDVTVIERADLERMPGRTLPEVLARVAGVQLAFNGGRGTSGGVFIRGAESRHTVLLIDGVRYGSATLGQPVWSNLPMEAIERIEVLKGPASSLYGSDAVGGVVQIFTRKGQAGFHPSAFVSMGSDGFAQVGAGLSGAQGPVRYAVDVSALNDGSFSATNPTAQYGNYNADRDPFRQRSINASLGLQVAPDWQIDAGLLRADGTAHFDDGPGRDTRSQVISQVGRLGVMGKVTPGWTTQLRVARSEDASTDIVSAYVPSEFKTAQTQVLWQNDVDTPLGVALLGLEQLTQQVSSTTAYDVTRRTVGAVFVGLNGEAGAHSWQVNVRSDRNSQFGRNTTGFVGYGYKITPTLRAFASHGTTFVAPSFNQLYYPNYGNPLLQPERGKNTDVGVSWSDAGHSVKLVYFDNKVRGFITSGRAPVNVPRARINGWTLSYQGSFGNWDMNASYDAMKPRNVLTGKQLPRRSDQVLSLGANYRLEAWKLGASLMHVGDRFDDTSNRFALKAYTTLDLNAEYSINKSWTLQTQLRNLTNAAYETARGYNQPGRGVFVTLRWKP